MMADEKVLKPGEEVQETGLYVQVNGKGEIMLDGREWGLNEGDPAIATQRKGWKWVMIHKARDLKDVEAEAKAPKGAPAGPYRGRTATAEQDGQDGTG